jgi:intracellular sulfur oxidation DsrE/DsrF family protein
MTRRRDFLARMTIGAAALAALDADELRAGSNTSRGAWDTSWIDKLASARYRVVFNASEVSEGAAFNFVSSFYNDYHEVHGTTDDQLRPVVVIRRLGTALALNDALWDRYAIGEDAKITDSATHAPARRNVFWKTATTTDDSSHTIETLQRRGMINLVCNVALGRMASRIAEATHKKAEDVQAEFRANLLPGAILVPSGIYALIRAQNAGCAWMPGT